MYILLISIFLSLFYLYLYSTYIPKLILNKKNIQIKILSLKGLSFIVKNYGIFFSIAIISFLSVIFIEGNNKLPLYLTIIGFIFYIISHQIYKIRGNIEITKNDGFEYKLKKINNRKIIFNNLLIHYILMYIGLGVIYLLDILDINTIYSILLIIPFINIINLSDGKYGFVNDIITFPLIITIFGFIFYKGNIEIIPFSYFIFTTFLILFEVIFLKLYNFITKQNRDALLGGIDIIILYLLILHLGIIFGFIAITVLSLFLIIENKVIKKNNKEKDFLFKHLRNSFYIFLIVISIFNSSLFF